MGEVDRFMRAWDKEFDVDFAVPEEILRLVADGTLIDHSWHNDAMPSFSSSAIEKAPHDGPLDIRLWVDYPDKLKSEVYAEDEEWHRFFVSQSDETTEWYLLYFGDDVNEAVKTLLAYQVKPPVIKA